MFILKELKRVREENDFLSQQVAILNGKVIAYEQVNKQHKALIEEARQREQKLLEENQALAYRCYQLSKELMEITQGVPEKGRGSFETACPEK
jgi:small-conductance mechanosensitive channel